MARKRPVEEIESFEVESLDAVDKPVSSANIHGMITSLSPVKKDECATTLMELSVMVLQNCAWWDLM